MPRVGVLEILSVSGEQLLGPGEIHSCSPGETQPEKNKGPCAERTCLPYCVARPAEVRQGAAQVLVCLVETPQGPQRAGAPHEHSPSQVAMGGCQRLIQHGQSLAAAASPCERCSEGSQHVG